MQDATPIGMFNRSFRYRHAATLAAAMSLGSLRAAAGSTSVTDVTNTNGPAQANAAVDAQADAKVRYEQGVQAYREQRFREAIDSFLSADSLVPRPALAFNIARAYEKLQEPARALQYYRDYLRRGPDESNAEEVSSRVRELEAELAARGVQQLTVRSNPKGATLSIDGAVRGTTPWTGELPLGTHDVRVQHEDDRAHRVSVTLDGGETLELALSLKTAQGPAPDPLRGAGAAGAGMTNASTADGGEPSTFGGGNLQPWPWVALGSGGAVLAAAGVFELLRRDAESDAQEARYQPEYHTHRERMSSYQTTARILIGAGAVLALGGGVLAFVDGAQADADADSEHPPVALGCDTTTCMGTWIGSF